MKTKTTQKAVKNQFPDVIAVPYCALQALLQYESPMSYTTRAEGWGADVYRLSNTVALATGYAPFGNIRPGFKINDKYEKAALAIDSNRSLGWQEQKRQIGTLIAEYLREVVHANT